jgi:hypothetical protein
MMMTMLLSSSQRANELALAISDWLVIQNLWDHKRKQT